MYTLLNVLKFGLKTVKKSKEINFRNKEKDIKLDDTLRLDFMSGIFFRVFENLISDENDPERF
jgi:hypothetical protein